VSDFFAGLFRRHNCVLRRLASTTVDLVAFLDQLLLEESRADFLVKRPNDRLDHVRFILPRRRIDVPLQIHFDRNAEPSVPDKVERPAVPAAHYIVRSGRIHDFGLCVMFVTTRRIRFDGSWIGNTTVVVATYIVTAVGGNDVFGEAITAIAITIRLDGIGKTAVVIALVVTVVAVTAAVRSAVVTVVGDEMFAVIIAGDDVTAVAVNDAIVTAVVVIVTGDDVTAAAVINAVVTAVAVIVSGDYVIAVVVSDVGVTAVVVIAAGDDMADVAVTDVAVTDVVVIVIGDDVVAGAVVDTVVVVDDDVTKAAIVAGGDDGVVGAIIAIAITAATT